MVDFSRVFIIHSNSKKSLLEKLKEYEGTHKSVPLILTADGRSQRFSLNGFSCRCWYDGDDPRYDVALTPFE